MTNIVSFGPGYDQLNLYYRQILAGKKIFTARLLKLGGH
jgi:hypothetical protein